MDYKFVVALKRFVSARVKHHVAEVLNHKRDPAFPESYVTTLRAELDEATAELENFIDPATLPPEPSQVSDEVADDGQKPPQA
jgi:hypothetical protein